MVVRTSEEGDSAVAHAHKEKLRKYETRCSAEAITFLPLAVDTRVVESDFRKSYKSRMPKSF